MQATRRTAIAAALALAGCGRTPDPGPIGVTVDRPIPISLQSITVDDQVQGLPLGFIDRRRTDEMVSAIRTYVGRRFSPTGGADSGRVFIEDASIIEQPLERGGISGAIAGPAHQLVGSLALKLAAIDGFGVEKGYARARIQLRRPVPETASVVDRDRLARDLINDMLRTIDTSLTAAVRENLGSYLATS
jgi:hypothetical protein